MGPYRKALNTKGDVTDNTRKAKQKLCFRCGRSQELAK